MTEDFKSKIVKYLTGSYEVGSGSNVPQFMEAMSTANNFQTTLSAEFPNGYGIVDIVQGVDSDNNGESLSVIYGYVQDETSLQTGFMVIVDEKFNILQIITSYSGGTQFGPWRALSVDDDGKFYGIEYANDTYRLVLMNNITIKADTDTEYKVKYRIGYNLDSTVATLTNYLIAKAPSESKYLIAGTTSTGYATASELTIKVGTENEWVNYTYTTSTFTIGDLLASWDSAGNLIFVIAGFIIDSSANLTYSELTGDSTVGTTMTLASYGSAFGDVEYYSMKKSSLTTAYISITTIVSSYYHRVLYMLSGSSISSIFTPSDVPLEPNVNINLMKNRDNEVFFTYPSYASGTGWTTNVGQLIGSDVALGELYTTGVHSTFSIFQVQKQFNLYNYFIQVEDTAYEIQSIYNSSNYNGEPYQALNSMIPNSGILYDSNNLILFARNLYNLQVNGSTTTSTLEIPNTRLNDVTIATENLIGQTNNELITNTQEITKNIYETLYLNFYNTLSMQNQNDTTNIINNPTGAVRVNTSISNLQDYEEMQATKVKLLYEDGTNYIMEIIPSSQIEIVDNMAIYDFTISVPDDKIVTGIQIISYDETTIYMEQDGLSLGSGNYSITQNVEVI